MNEPKPLCLLPDGLSERRTPFKHPMDEPTSLHCHSSLQVSYLKLHTVLQSKRCKNEQSNINPIHPIGNSFNSLSPDKNS